MEGRKGRREEGGQEEVRKGETRKTSVSSGKISQDLVSHIKKFGLYLLSDGKNPLKWPKIQG